jgi:hypothetical protein
MKRKTKAAFGRVADDETFVSDSWTSKSCYRTFAGSLTLVSPTGLAMSFL